MEEATAFSFSGMRSGYCCACAFYIYDGRSGMRGILLLSLCAFFISGCTRIPQPTGYALSEQQKLQAAYHWNVLANDVANQINSELIERGYLDTSVYVKHSCNEGENCGPAQTFPFDEGFNDLLTTQLVNFGVPTSPEEDEKSLVVDYKVQVLYHQANRYQWPRPGGLTALTAGIMVFRNAPFELATLVGAAAVDALWSTSVVNGNYEVIITTSIVDNNLYIMRKSDIYYINDPDFWHYLPVESANELELTSSGY